MESAAIGRDDEKTWDEKSVVNCTRRPCSRVRARVRNRVDTVTLDHKLSLSRNISLAVAAGILD